MGSSKEHKVIRATHNKGLRAGIARIMHAMRNGHLYRSTDGINWNLESDPAVAPVDEGLTRVTDFMMYKSIKNK